MSHRHRGSRAQYSAWLGFAWLVLVAGCARPQSRAIGAETVEYQVTLAIDSLAAGMQSLQPDRMLAAWAPGSDVLHVSNTGVARVDTLLPSLYPVWRSRRAFTMTWTMRALRILGPASAVATTSVRFVATDTLGVTTTREGVWTLVFEELRGAWKIVADHRTMDVVPASGPR